MTCPCPSYEHRQGKGDCECSRQASEDAIRSPLVISIAAVAAVIALGLCLQALRLPVLWPF